MDLGLPKRRKKVRQIPSVEIRFPEKNEPPIKASDLLSFFSAVVALIAGAIFYISGWVYEANWHSFYGIQLSQVSLSTQQIMIAGVPGIVILMVSAILSLTIIAILRRFQKLSMSPADLPTFSFDDLPTFAMITYAIVGFVLILFILRLLSIGLPVPGEAIISGLTIPLIAFILLVIFQLTNMVKRLLGGASTTLPYFLARSTLGVIVIAAATALFGVLNSYIISYVEDQRIKILRSFAETGKVWLSLVLLTAFFISIAISAMMGVINAHSGSRMMGNWQMSPVYLYTDTQIELLPTHASGKPYAYGPLGLLTVSDQDYYFVEWNGRREYDWHPDIYVVPRSENEVLVFKEPTTTTPTQVSTPLPVAATTTPIPTMTGSPPIRSPTP